tara:strand:- start:15 stop:1220 length:1206 start_codon:yes stop_codon:yes gene_type:complete
MNVQSLNVESLSGQGISSLIQSLTIYENINGYMRGKLHLFDGIGFYDKIIGITNKLIPINFSFNYLGVEHNILFYIDGFSDMQIKRSKKDYIIHLITPVEHSLKLVKVNAVYSGKSHEILNQIFFETTGSHKHFIVESKASTDGKYIVPNISAFEAIENVKNSAVDDYYSGFYIFQKLINTGRVTFASHESIANNFMPNEKGERFRITDAIVAASDIKHKGFKGNEANIGTTNKYKLEEYKMDYTEKLAAGYYGNIIHNIHLDNTKVEKNKKLDWEEGTDIKTTYKISDNLYDYVTKPSGPAGQTSRYQQKSLFVDNILPGNMSAVNLKRRSYNTFLSLMDMISIPLLGCGQSIMVEMGGAEDTYESQNGPYIIADINHIFTRNQEGFEYRQNMSLIREYA